MSIINSLPTPSFTKLRDKLLSLYQDNKGNKTKEDYEFDVSSLDKLFQEIETEDYNIVSALFYVLIPIEKNGYKGIDSLSLGSIRVMEMRIKNKFISYMKTNAETLPVEAWDALVLFYLKFIYVYQEFPPLLAKKIIYQMFQTSTFMKKLYIKAIKNMLKNQLIIDDEGNENKIECDINLSDKQKIFLIKNVLSKISKKGQFTIKINSAIVDSLARYNHIGIINTILSQPSKFIIMDDDCYKKISVLALSNNEIKEKLKKFKGKYTDKQRMYIEFLKRYFKLNKPIKADNLLEEYSFPFYYYNYIDIKKMIQENDKITNEEILRYIDSIISYLKGYRNISLEKLIEITARVIPPENLNINIGN